MVKRMTTLKYKLILVLIVLFEFIVSDASIALASQSDPIFPVNKSAGGWYALTYWGHDVYGAYQKSAIDINNVNGSAGWSVFAIQDGTINYLNRSTGTIVLHHTTPLILRNGYVYNTWMSQYSHMDNIPSNYQEGTSISQGTVIGKTASVGANAPHLHFALYSQYGTADDAISPYWLSGDYYDYDLYADDTKGTRYPAGLYEALIFADMPSTSQSGNPVSTVWYNLSANNKSSAQNNVTDTDHDVYLEGYVKYEPNTLLTSAGCFLSTAKSDVENATPSAIGNALHVSDPASSFVTPGTGYSDADGYRYTKLYYTAKGTGNYGFATTLEAGQTYYYKFYSIRTVNGVQEYTPSEVKSFTTTGTSVLPVYSITASPSSLSFGTLPAGYAAPAAQTVTITNTGNTTQTLREQSHINYNMVFSKTTLAPNEQATVTVQPRSGLGAGDYSTTLLFETGEGASISVNVSFAVERSKVETVWYDEFVTDITQSDASMAGFIEFDADQSLTEVGYFMGTTEAQTNGASVSYANGTISRNTNGTIHEHYENYVSNVVDETTRRSSVVFQVSGFLVSTGMSLEPGTTYYFRFYSVLSDGSIAYSDMLSFKTLEEAVYQITASPASLSFGTLPAGYAAPAAQTVTITNTGNQTVTLTQPIASKYAIGALSTTTLAPNATATFTVAPKTGLDTGTHNESIVINTNSTASANVSVGFTVNAPVYSIAVTPDTLDFGTITVGDQPTGKTVTIINNGDVALTLDTQGQPQYFTVSNYSKTTLQPGETATAVVTPNSSLTAGNYDTSFYITTDVTDVAALLDVKLTVKAAEITPKPTILTKQLPAAALGQEYKQKLLADGAEPIRWSVVAGRLPDGLMLAPDGTISGVPTKEGAFAFTVCATGSNGASTVQQMYLLVEIPAAAPVPQTGDNTPLAALLILTLCALTGMLTLNKTSKKHSTTK